MPSFNTKKQRGRLFNKFNKTLRNNIKRSNKRSKSLEPPKNINSEEIGSGGFGIVSRPPAKCNSFINENFNQNALKAAYYGNPNYISKLTEYTSAIRELEIALAIKEEIPSYDDYFCLVEFICNAPESKTIIRDGDFYGTYAISPYGGIPFSEYLREDIQAPISIFELCNFVPALQLLIQGIYQIHKKHIYQKDIHTENILYDSNSGLLRLIDFGLADDFRRIKNDNRPVIINEEHHDMDMLLKNVIIPLVKFILDDERINNSRTYIKYPFIEDFYYQMEEFYDKIGDIMNPYKKESFRNISIKDQLTRILNVVYHFQKLKNINQLSYQYYETYNNNNTRRPKNNNKSK
jgi:serine/threonine protein kinase